MRRVHLGVVAAAAVLAVAALSACGSSDDNSADDGAITAAIDEAATSGDPAACTEVQTQKFLEQTNGGKNALKSCQKDAADTVADEVDVTNMEVDGDTATADAAVTGSVFDGQTLQIALVKDGDQWKLDEFTGFADFNREAFAKAFLAEIAKDPKTPAQVLTCLKQQVDQASDQELEDAFVQPNGGEKLFAPCGG
jgi:hypothetical protein